MAMAEVLEAETTVRCLHCSADDDREYKALNLRVSQQVFRINGNISSIERLAGYLGGSRDNQYILNKLTRPKSWRSSPNVRLLTAKKARQRKLKQQKLSKDFQKILNDFQTIQRLSSSKQRWICV
ncbi:hypothetical protein BX666DRAFT_1972127 [Dichotomocladium elegans]|nr:hypothetical protein BX666DRAFT_1972127 [Dichotomocladium elegans]